MTMTDSLPSPMLVLCNCPNQAVAIELAQQLLQHRLAACVNVLPGVQSLYRWQGRIEREHEVTLLIKTTRPRYEALERLLAAAHPYDVPEIIALPVSAGLPAYLGWLEDECRD